MLRALAAQWTLLQREVGHGTWIRLMGEFDDQDAHEVGPFFIISVEFHLYLMGYIYFKNH